MFKILEPFFHALSDGKIIRLTVAWVLRVLAVLGALVAIILFIAFVAFGIKMYGNNDFGQILRGPAGGIGILLGSFLLGVFALCQGYLAAGICMFRARTVLDLDDSHFTVLSIVSILFRLAGELIFVTYAILGIGLCLFSWFAESARSFSDFGPLRELPFSIGPPSGFLGGIEIAIGFLLLAFIGIVVCYALAELSIVLVEIALNTRGLNALKTALNDNSPLLSAAPGAGGNGHGAVAFVPVTSPVKCRHCGQLLESGVSFCAECGTPVG